MSNSSYKFHTVVRILLYTTAFVAIVASSYCSCGKLHGIDAQDKNVLLPGIGGLWPGDYVPHPHIPDQKPENEICDGGMDNPPNA